MKISDLKIGRAFEVKSGTQMAVVDAPLFSDLPIGASVLVTALTMNAIRLVPKNAPDRRDVLAFIKEVREFLVRLGVKKDGKHWYGKDSALGSDTKPVQLEIKMGYKEVENLWDALRKAPGHEIAEVDAYRGFHEDGPVLRLGDFEVGKIEWNDTGEDIRYQGEFIHVKNIGALDKADALADELLAQYGKVYEFPKNVVDLLVALGGTDQKRSASSPKQSAFWKFKAAELLDAIKKWGDPEVKVTEAKVTKSKDGRFYNKVDFNVQIGKGGTLSVTADTVWKYSQPIDSFVEIDLVPSAKYTREVE